MTIHSTNIVQNFLYRFVDRTSLQPKTDSERNSGHFGHSKAFSKVNASSLLTIKPQVLRKNPKPADLRFRRLRSRYLAAQERRRVAELEAPREQHHRLHVPVPLSLVLEHLWQYELTVPLRSLLAYST